MDLVITYPLDDTQDPHECEKHQIDIHRELKQIHELKPVERLPRDLQHVLGRCQLLRRLADRTRVDLLFRHLCDDVRRARDGAELPKVHFRFHESLSTRRHLVVRQVQVHFLRDSEMETTAAANCIQ